MFRVMQQLIFRKEKILKQYFNTVSCLEQCTISVYHRQFSTEYRVSYFLLNSIRTQGMTSRISRAVIATKTEYPLKTDRCNFE